MDANKPNDNPNNNEQNDGLDDFNLDDLGDLDDLSGSPAPVNNSNENNNLDDMIVVEESSDNDNIDVEANNTNDVDDANSEPVDPTLVNEEIPIQADNAPIVISDALSDDLGGELSSENSELVDSLPPQLDSMLADSASHMEEALDLDAPDSSEATLDAVPAPTPAPAPAPAATQAPTPTAAPKQAPTPKQAPAAEIAQVAEENDLTTIDGVIDELSAPLDDEEIDVNANADGNADIDEPIHDTIKSEAGKSKTKTEITFDSDDNNEHNDVSDEEDEVAKFEEDAALAAGAAALAGAAVNSDEKNDNKKSGKLGKMFGFLSRKKKDNAKNDSKNDNRNDNRNDNKPSKSDKSAKAVDKDVKKDKVKSTKPASNKDKKIAFAPIESDKLNAQKPQGNIFVRFLKGTANVFAHSFDGAVDLFYAKPFSFLLLFIGVVPFWLPIVSGVRGYIYGSGGFDIYGYSFSPVFCGLFASIMILLVRGYYSSFTVDSRYFPVRYAVGIGRLLLNYVLTGILIFMFIFFAFWALLWLFKVSWLYGLVSFILVFAVFYYTRALLRHPLSKPLFIDIILSLLWLEFTISSTYGVQLFFVAFAVNLIVMWSNGHFDVLKDETETNDNDDNSTHYKNEQDNNNELEELSEIDEVLEEHGKTGRATR